MRIGIIGTGIIASAVVTGFCEKKTGHEFFLSPRNAHKAAVLAAAYPGVTVCASNQEVVDSAEWVFNCLHKKDFGALSELVFRSGHKVANISAEMRLPELRRIIGETKCLAHIIPLPFIMNGNGPLVVYPEIAEVGELFAPVSDVFFTHSQADAQTLQIITGLMSPFNMLLSEIVQFSDEQGIDHDVSVRFLCSLFGSLCRRAASIPNCDLVELAFEMTPGGYNEQAMKDLSENGALQAWRTALDRLHARLQASSS